MMSTSRKREHGLKLAKAPIVEAVLDIDCDMRPDFDLSTTETAARDAYSDAYPKLQIRRFKEHRIQLEGDAEPQFSTRDGVEALMFLDEDQKQIVQVRNQGFSFNRLAPYSSLDDYLPEMERTWSIFVPIIRPLRIRAVKLRYINRILLPAVEDKLDLDDYLKLGPRVPEGDKLSLLNFMNRNVAVDVKTGHLVTIVLASQQSESNKLPVIFDIAAADGTPLDSTDWGGVGTKIQSLRDLKNYVFESTLKEKCMELFQ
jgi:uncharacterized protein (TIGR04255 family)